MPRHSDKSANLHIRLPAAEYAAFVKAADRASFDLTTWVRFNLRRAAGMDSAPGLTREPDSKKK